MQTVADFKRAMQVGSKWLFVANWWPNPTERQCTVCQTNRFALSSVKTPNESSWCDWPKKHQCEFIAGGVKITHETGWLFYKPLINSLDIELATMADCGLCNHPDIRPRNQFGELV